MAASSSAESKMYTASYSRDNAGNPPFGHVRLPRVAVAEGEWLRSGGRRARRAISRQINNLALARTLVKAGNHPLLAVDRTVQVVGASLQPSLLNAQWG